MSPATLNVSSSDTDLLVKLGLDPAEFTRGSEQVERSTKKMGATLATTSRASRIVSRDLTQLGNSVLMLSGVSGQSARAMSLLSNGINLAQSAALGLVGPIGLAITAVGALAAVLINYAQEAGSAKKATVELGNSIAELHERAIKAADLLPTDVKADLKNKIAELQVEIDLLSGKQVEITPGKFAVVEGDLSKFAKRLAEAKSELAAVETELSSLEVRLLLKSRAELKRFLEEARAAIEDLPVPMHDLSIIKAQVPERIPEWMGSITEDVDFATMQGAKEGEAYWKEAQERLKKGNELVGESLSRSLASSFVGVFSAGEEGFANMLKQWGTTLAESAVFAILMSIFNPGKSFSGFFKSALGFQHGTEFVPHTGLAMLHRGEAIIPASQNFSNTSTRTTSTTNAGVTIENVNLIGISDLPRLVKQIEDLARQRRSSLALVN